MRDNYEKSTSEKKQEAGFAVFLVLAAIGLVLVGIGGVMVPIGMAFLGSSFFALAYTESWYNQEQIALGNR